MMRKKHIAALYNEANATLIHIRDDLIKYIRENSDHECNPDIDAGYDIVCFKFRDQAMTVSSTKWTIDGESVTFFQFLATITQE